MTLLLLGLACWRNPDTVVLSGAVHDAPEGSGEGVSDVDLATLDSSGAPVDEGRTGSGGGFSVEVAANQAFFVLMTRSATTTSISGLAGEADIHADQGELWAHSDEDMDALVTLFEGCPGVDETGGVVEGLARHYLPVDAETSELPIVTRAVGTLTDSLGIEHSACYLDDDGVSDPEAEMTGETGRFAVFGLPEGVALLSFTFTVEEGADEQDGGTHLLWVPEGGVAPVWPAWGATL